MTALRTLAVAAVAALAPLAAAASTKPERYAGRTSQDIAIRLHVAADRSAISVIEIGYRDRCSNGRSYVAYTRVRRVVLYGRRFATHGTYLAGTTEDRYTVAGTVTVRAARGYFALHASGTDSDGRMVTCRTGRIDWTARRAHRR